MIEIRRPVGPGATALGLAAAAVVVATLLAGPLSADGAWASRVHQLSPSARTPPSTGACTMIIPLPRATIEAQIANAGDFCEIISKALATEVFRSAVIVTPGRLWHYPDAPLSCRLRYRRTPGRMTIRNSAAACRWFTRTATGWRRTTGLSASLP